MSGYFSFFIETSVYTSPTGGDGYVSIQQQKTALLLLSATNRVNATRFVQIFDTASQGSPSGVPVMELQVNANSQGSIDLSGAHWLPLTKGLLIASSTTSGTYTAGGATDLFLTALYFSR